MNPRTTKYFNQWVKYALINLLIVASVGVILRYKINFPLPIINQKYLLHAHSHFAFAGWVTQILMALIVQYLYQQNEAIHLKRYTKIFWANLITAYGMLLSFPFQGYSFLSIIFSTLSVFVSYYFIACVWNDLKLISNLGFSKSWFKASLVLYAISSIGPFSLAYLMANHISAQNLYFGAVYFFLHFQYNGWFLFACFGFFFNYLQKAGVLNSTRYSKKIFKILIISCVPTYLLSTLWMNPPMPLYFLALVAALLQLFALFYMKKIYTACKDKLRGNLSPVTKWLWVLACIAFCLKIILQAFSTIPALSQYAFGFRPIVIGYLHLSFLCIISFFILGYINQYLSLQKKQLSRTGIFFFITGVLITETTLMLQGFAAISFNYLPFTDILLFIAAIIIATGLLLIVMMRQSFD